MKESEINFKITLDEQSIPEKIVWNATDGDFDDLRPTKAISISTWDHQTKNSLRMDLWTKDMPVDEMKRFYIDCIGGLGQSLLSSTGDEFMSGQVNELCDKLVEYVKKS